MKKLTIGIILVIIPYFTYAGSDVATTTPNQVQLLTCKNEALKRKEKSMQPALKAYVASSEIITLKSKKDLDSIKWLINSTYTNEFQRIERERFAAMIPVNEKISKARLIAQATWKAEDALCELSFTKKKK